MTDTITKYDVRGSDVARAYQRACEANNLRGGGSVAIHVGTDVYEWLREQATIEDKDPETFGQSIGKLWGFPLVHEQYARPEHISVRVVTVIA